MSTVETAAPAAPVTSVDRPVTAVAGGAVIVACAVAAALAVAVPDRTVATSAPRPGWEYTPALWPLLVALAVAGLAAVARPRSARPAAAVAAIVAVQLAGIGWVAVREWFATYGLGGLDRHSLVALHGYAAAVPLAATAAAVTAAALVWREPAAGWRGLIPSRPGYVLAGAATVLLLPPAWDVTRVALDINGFRHVATPTYTLSWGAGLAAAGWLRGRTGNTAALTVAVSIAVCLLYVGAVCLHAFLFPPPPGD